MALTWSLTPASAARRAACSVLRASSLTRSFGSALIALALVAAAEGEQVVGDAG